MWPDLRQFQEPETFRPTGEYRPTPGQKAEYTLAEPVQKNRQKPDRWHPVL